MIRLHVIYLYVLHLNVVSSFVTYHYVISTHLIYLYVLFLHKISMFPYPISLSVSLPAFGHGLRERCKRSGLTNLLLGPINTTNFFYTYWWGKTLSIAALYQDFYKGSSRFGNFIVVLFSSRNYMQNGMELFSGCRWRLIAKFGYCPSWTVSIVLAFHKCKTYILGRHEPPSNKELLW